MKWQFSVDYPQTPGQVMAAFMDPAFHAQKLASMGASDAEVLSSEVAQGRFHIRIRRRMQLDVDVPAFLRKAAASGVGMTQDESWDASGRTGELVFEMGGLPVEVRCAARLEPVPGGCRVRYDWDIRARVPVVGGTVEKLLVSDLERKLANETRVVRDLLARRGA